MSWRSSTMARTSASGGSWSASGRPWMPRWLAVSRRDRRRTTRSRPCPGSDREGSALLGRPKVDGQGEDPPLDPGGGIADHGEVHEVDLGLLHELAPLG